MIATWNVRGLNKATRHMEIGSRLRKLKCACVALLLTRAKKTNAERIRNKLGKWSSVDNYSNHDNGRIWLLWDIDAVEFKFHSSSEQFRHWGMYKRDGNMICWLTAVYMRSISLN